MLCLVSIYVKPDILHSSPCKNISFILQKSDINGRGNEGITFDLLQDHNDHPLLLSVVFRKEPPCADRDSIWFFSPP